MLVFTKYSFKTFFKFCISSVSFFFCSFKFSSFFFSHLTHHSSSFFFLLQFFFSFSYSPIFLPSFNSSSLSAILLSSFLASKQLGWMSDQSISNGTLSFLLTIKVFPYSRAFRNAHREIAVSLEALYIVLYTLMSI